MSIHFHPISWFFDISLLRCTMYCSSNLAQLVSGLGWLGPQGSSSFLPGKHWSDLSLNSLDGCYGVSRSSRIRMRLCGKLNQPTANYAQLKHSIHGLWHGGSLLWCFGWNYRHFKCHQNRQLSKLNPGNVEHNPFPLPTAAEILQNSLAHLQAPAVQRAAETWGARMFLSGCFWKWSTQ
jgi:hypothetical protein